MRRHIIRTLLQKECYRLLANKGGITLLLMLVVASLLLSLFDGRQGGANLTAGVRLCYVDYWHDDGLVRHLRRHLPAGLEDQIVFRRADRVERDGGGALLYPHNTGAIQLRPRPSDPEGPGFLVWLWHPGADGAALAPFEAWFWKETLSFFIGRQQEAANAAAADSPALPARALQLPPIDVARSELKGGLDQRSGFATSLLLFGLFFVCVYLQSSLTCEERERGVLLAQALSPASAREILAAKFLVYPALGLGLAVLMAGMDHPAALRSLFFWLALSVSVLGAMGVGLTISTLARTQRTASIGAMSYMLVVALLLFVCQQNSIPFLPYLALEYHCPRMLHAALTDAVLWYHWAHLLGAALLACGWAILAAVLFRRLGWQ